jgi:hypothetical protein
VTWNHTLLTRRQKSPSHFDRDSAETVKRAWIHKEGTDNYITSKGPKLVEAAETMHCGLREPSTGLSAEQPIEVRWAAWVPACTGQGADQCHVFAVAIDAAMPG